MQYWGWSRTRCWAHTKRGLVDINGLSHPNALLHWFFAIFPARLQVGHGTFFTCSFWSKWSWISFESLCKTNFRFYFWCPSGKDLKNMNTAFSHSSGTKLHSTMPRTRLFDFDFISLLWQYWTVRMSSIINFQNKVAWKCSAQHYMSFRAFKT